MFNNNVIHGKDSILNKYFEWLKRPLLTNRSIFHVENDIHRLISISSVPNTNCTRCEIKCWNLNRIKFIEMEYHDFDKQTNKK